MFMLLHLFSNPNERNRSDSDELFQLMERHDKNVNVYITYLGNRLKCKHEQEPKDWEEHKREEQRKAWEEYTNKVCKEFQ